MKCCFCECELIDGNSPYPFFVLDGEDNICCDICNAYITPFRLIYKKYSISKEDVYRMGYEIKNNIMFLNELSYNDKSSNTFG